MTSPIRRDEVDNTRAEEGGSLWKAFEANEITHSGAHYLLAIHDLSTWTTALRAADIARFLGVTRAAVSLRVRALVDHGFVEMGPQRSVHLTARGASVVARVSSKREVLRAFFGDVLRVRAATAVADACKIEHLISEESGAALLRLIHFLRSDHPAARACLEGFYSVSSRCPGNERCDVCSSVCLISLGPEGSFPAREGTGP